ncbi:SHSP domain-containing protein [Mycena kentingensis (nom. inval.)]|nr:SHSP domain-containing protein [Mycena kentingensis (nom. inval.)]
MDSYFPDQYTAEYSSTAPAAPTWDQQSQHSDLVVTPTQIHHQPALASSASASATSPPHLVPAHVQPRGTHDMTPVRLVPPRELQPIVLDTARASSSTSSTTCPTAKPARPHVNAYHPYARSDAAREVTRYNPHSPEANGNGFTAASPHSDYATGQQQGASPHSDYMPLGHHASPQGRGRSPATNAAPQKEREKRFIIRTDAQYDSSTRIWTAYLELPGVKRSDVRVQLATTPYNHQRQVVVTGHSRPVLPFPVYASTADGAPSLSLRERKYGRFSRKLPVPADTRTLLFPASTYLDPPLHIRSSTDGRSCLSNLCCYIPLYAETMLNFFWCIISVRQTYAESLRLQHVLPRNVELVLLRVLEPSFESFDGGEQLAVDTTTLPYVERVIHRCIRSLALSNSLADILACGSSSCPTAVVVVVVGMQRAPSSCPSAPPSSDGIDSDAGGGVVSAIYSRSPSSSAYDAHLQAPFRLRRRGMVLPAAGWFGSRSGPRAAGSGRLRSRSQRGGIDWFVARDLAPLPKDGRERLRVSVEMVPIVGRRMPRD